MLRKILAGILFFSLLVTISFAGENYRMPLDRNGNIPTTVDFVGVESYYIPITSAAVNITTDPCIVYGALLGGGYKTTDYIQIFDDYVKVTSATVTPKLYYESTSTNTAHYFVYGIKLDKGLTVAGCSTALQTTDAVIFYRKRKVGN